MSEKLHGVERLIANVQAAGDEVLVDVCLENGLLSANIGTIAEVKELVTSHLALREKAAAVMEVFKEDFSCKASCEYCKAIAALRAELERV